MGKSFGGKFFWKITKPQTKMAVTRALNAKPRLGGTRGTRQVSAYFVFRKKNSRKEIEKKVF